MPTSATPVQIVDDNGKQITSFGSGTPAATDGSNNRRVVGDSNSGAADSGSSPVKVGVVFNSTPPTYTSGQRADLQSNNRGALYVNLTDSFNQSLGMANGSSDGLGASLIGLPGNSRNYVFNGTTWDRARGDINGSYSVSKGGSNIATGQIAVGTSSTLVVAAKAGRQKITLAPTSSTVYYVGASGVTASNGLYVPAGGTLTLDTAAAVYAIGASALTVSFIEYF